MGNTYGVLALISGIIGLICCFFLGFILGPIAIIFGIIGIKRDDETGQAITGICLGILDIILGIIVFIVMFIIFAVPL